MSSRLFEAAVGFGGDFELEVEAVAGRGRIIVVALDPVMDKSELFVDFMAHQRPRWSIVQSNAYGVRGTTGRTI
jgi:hypothetical protein